MSLTSGCKAFPFPGLGFRVRRVFTVQSLGWFLGAGLKELICWFRV